MVMLFMDVYGERGCDLTLWLFWGYKMVQAGDDGTELVTFEIAFVELCLIVCQGKYGLWRFSC